jgi:hypothetical protein
MIAMVGAMSLVNDYHNGAEQKRDRSARRVAKIVGVSHPTVLKAFLVKQYAPDLVPGIIAGKLFLDPAYVTAQEGNRLAGRWLAAAAQAGPGPGAAQSLQGPAGDGIAEDVSGPWEARC